MTKKGGSEKPLSKMMARKSNALVLALAAGFLAAAPSPNGTPAGRPVLISALAPADEYFGREHLSALVIRHKIFALKDDLHHMREQPDAIAHDAAGVQDALF